MTKVTLDDWDTARVVFYKVLNNWDQQDPNVKAQMEEMQRVIKDNLERQAKNKAEEAGKKAAAKRMAAAERKRLRDIAIPEWCEKYLEPGMAVTVKAANTKMRLVESIKPTTTMGNGYKFDGYVTGRHIRTVRQRHRDTKEISFSLQYDGYITDHVLRNVTGVVTGLDERGQPIVTTIMDLVDEVKNFNVTAALSAVQTLTKSSSTA